MPKRRLILLLAALVVPFVLLRLYLHTFPNADFDVAGYNVHHLFTGLIFITLGGIPLALYRDLSSRLMDTAVVTFGIGLSLALDEWVYLIVTDGSNASYLLPVSLWGGAAAIGMACLYTLAVVALAQRRRPPRTVAVHH